MSEMIDRVAKAIFQRTDPKWDWDNSTDFIKRETREIARAAIEAMRDPTEAMLKAIPPQSVTIEHYHGTGHHNSFPTLGSGPLSVWHSMIESALSKANPHSLSSTPTPTDSDSPATVFPSPSSPGSQFESDGPKSLPGDAAASFTQSSKQPATGKTSAQERSSDRSGGQFGDAPKPAHIPSPTVRP